MLITYFDEQETILFAVGELRRLLRKAGIESTLQYNEKLKESTQDEKRILLVTRKQYEVLLNVDKVAINLKLDGFAIVKQGSNIWIIGEEPRSVLYGIYKYCEIYMGYRWIHLNQEELVHASLNEEVVLSIFEPSFQRRGNIIETIDDPMFINSLIDWGVKNGHNEYFFTFFLWEKVKAYVAPALQKRGVKVTLGGHSLQFLLNEIEIESGRQENLSFFTKDQAIQELVIDKIVDICKENEVISRISLWPEDVGLEEKNGLDFISSYIIFTENLNKSLKSSGQSVEVEHIVYNAGLSWNMLERGNDTNVSSDVDVLFAYWGRNYADSIKSQEINQQRASHALKDWNEQVIQNGRNLTVLEYYSDHFMLSELFPPLARRIDEDLKDYQQQNVTGTLNLIVPPHLKEHSSEMDKRYPWKWVQHFNNYIYTKLAWGEELERALDLYFQSYQDPKKFKRTFLLLEEIIAPHTQWNIPLFPARVVDPEKVTNIVEVQEILNYLQKIGQFFDEWDFTKVETLLSIYSKDNNQSYNSEEMSKFYFYYVKTIAEKTLQEWLDK